jgi:hypothetical protein
MVRRAIVQAGVLAGVGLGLFVGPEAPAEAGPFCEGDVFCAFRKPLFLFALDYSTAMNVPHGQQGTRWDAAVDGVRFLIDENNGLLQEQGLIAVMRFGHDPDAEQPGTVIPGDASGLVDGQRLDVPFYDADHPDKKYLSCNGTAIAEALEATPPPLGGQLQGIGAWTRGAMLRAAEIFADAALAHPDDPKRHGAVVVITQGAWTDAAGAQVFAPLVEDPAPVAAAMFNDSVIPTYVVSFGDDAGDAAASELAVAGGTGVALPVVDSNLWYGLLEIVEYSKDDLFVVQCRPVIPRVMLLVDASSSMLNVADGTQAGGPGETAWDEVRAALGGPDSLFAQMVFDTHKFAAIVDVGAAVFGASGEEKLILDYVRGGCGADRLGWALDPWTSCGDGCVDPWGGPPIAWTFRDGSQSDPPGFAEPTFSHMPTCDEAQPGQAFCSGSGSRVELGLELVRQNIAQYKVTCADPESSEPCSESTPFMNFVITDGMYEASDAAVEAPLVQMQADGVTTYVIGFGEAASDPAAVEQWAKMASWGSAGAKTHFVAHSQAELIEVIEGVVVGVVEETNIDPCCTFPDTCPSDPEGGTDGSSGEPPDETSSSGGTTGDEATGSGGDTTINVPADSSSSEGEGGTTGGADTGEAPTTGGDATTGGAPATTVNDGSSGGSAGEGGEPGMSASDGCGCASAPDTGSGALLCGLAGLARRRRRAGGVSDMPSRAGQ